ncbi:MAG TPA: hypothetical protein V6C65_02700, partial [Allocoleopsis sp.]
MADINNIEHRTRPDYSYDSATHTRRVTPDEIAQRNDEIAHRHRDRDGRIVDDRINNNDRVNEDIRRRNARKNAREVARVERVRTLVHRGESPIERERSSTAIGLML